MCQSAEAFGRPPARFGDLFPAGAVQAKLGRGAAETGAGSSRSVASPETRNSMLLPWEITHNYFN